MSEKEKIRISTLQRMAIRYFEAMTRDDEIRQKDVTHTYYHELRMMLQKNELINVQINGLPGSGKSTVMIAEVQRVNDILGKETTIDHILPNQIVYAQVMKEIRHRMDVCIGIDEYDELGETGYNATVEQSALNHYSDLHRAHYIHKFSCSPKDTVDKNAFLFLEILGADKDKHYTRCLLYYKLFVRGMDHLQLIGHVDIDVSNILNTSMYTQYDERKMHRLRLFSIHGIQHERHIFAAKLILKAYEGLRPLAKYTKLTKENCKLKVEMAARELKVMNSILTTMSTAGDLLALLSYVRDQEQFKARIKKIKRMLGKSPELEMEQKMAIEELSQHLEHLCTEEQKAIRYWEDAAKLEELYISNLGKDTHGVPTVNA